jgi:hypothetical protein
MAKPEPKEHVKQHLKNRDMTPEQVSGDVISALNEFTPDELLKLVDNLGDKLMKDHNLSPGQRISAVH